MSACGMKAIVVSVAAKRPMSSRIVEVSTVSSREVHCTGVYFKLNYNFVNPDELHLI